MKRKENGETTKKSKKYICITLILILAICTTVYATGPYAPWNKEDDTEDTSDNDDSKQKPYDDSRIEISDKTDVPQDTGSITTDTYSDFAVSTGESIKLTNPSSNDVNFRYVVSINNTMGESEDGTPVLEKVGDVIYTSEEDINPGNYLPWIPSNYVKKGETDTVISIYVFDDDGNQYYGYWFPVKITVQ